MLFQQRNLAIGLFLFLFCCPSFAAQKRPKLLLMIVLDQFRADYLTRFESRFLPAQGKNGEVGGFRYLMTKGAYFPQGQYDILQSVTAPGHATVLTGSYPYQAGIPNNDWFDSDLQKKTYCTDDSRFPLVDSKEPTSSKGVSPQFLIATTVGDELKNAGFPSRVVSVALKDRAAVLMGGHRADLALWFDADSNQWTTSRFYIPEGGLPEWVQKLNRDNVPAKGGKLEWKLSNKSNGNSSENSLALTDARNAGKMGKDFPHSVKVEGEGVFFMPTGVDMTISAAEQALVSYNLGKGKATDLLAVSISTHDFVAHSFGPNSREMEEITVHEDQAISRLLNLIRTKVPGGLQETVIALTGDHGGPPSPEWATAHRIKAGRIDEFELGKALSKHLNEKFGQPNSGDWLTLVTDFNFFLNHPAIRAKKINLAEVEAKAKSFLAKTPGVAFVVTSTDYAARKLPPGMHERQILHTNFPGRSDDLIIIHRPYYIPSGPKARTSTHITGYSYDRTVPIILAGPNIQSGIYGTRAEVIDIAPTFSFFTGTIPPSLSEGRVLSEILKKD